MELDSVPRHGTAPCLLMASRIVAVGDMLVVRRRYVDARNARVIDLDYVMFQLASVL